MEASFIKIEQQGAEITKKHIGRQGSLRGTGWSFIHLSILTVHADSPV
jgi:hypothetical protein